MNFAEIQIFGKELLNPIFNYVSSNLLSNTSNTLKGDE